MSVKNSRKFTIPRVHFAAEVGWPQAEARRLDKAIWKNLRELGYDV